MINFIEIYNNLVMVIDQTKINYSKGLPQGSALSPLLFNLYINNALIELNKINGLSAQAYADDLILQSKDIDILQIAYNKTKDLYKSLDLIINSNKCELITDNEEERIFDYEQETEIISKSSAKYLGQIINYSGVPTTNISNVNFGELLKIIIKQGQLTRIAKIRLFHIYMKSKINHLIPLLSIAGKIKDLWKNIREIIFRYLLEYSTLQRESALSFKLSFYDIIVRPVLKLIEKNKNYTNDIEEENMLNESLKEIFNIWLIAEPKHTDEIKQVIIKNIENNFQTSYDEFDALMAKESTERLYKGHNVNIEEAKKLRKIKSPGLIVLISNEPKHEIKQRIKNY